MSELTANGTRYLTKISCKFFPADVAAWRMLQHPLCSIHTLSESFIRSLTPCNCLANVPLPADNHRPVSRPSPPPPPPPSECVDFTHFVWEGGKESSGPGGLQRERAQPKASAGRPEGRPLFAEPSPGQERHWGTVDNVDEREFNGKMFISLSIDRRKHCDCSREAFSSTLWVPSISESQVLIQRELL